MTKAEQLVAWIELIALEPQEPLLLHLCIQNAGWHYCPVIDDLTTTTNWHAGLNKEDFYSLLSKYPTNRVAVIVRFKEKAADRLGAYPDKYTGYYQYVWET